MTDLPALEVPQCYVVVGPDDQRGPYTMELLVAEVAAGRLDDNTPVWWPGLADWTTMAAHAGVAAEVARRRSPAEPAPMAFAPPAAPPPPQQPTSQQPTPAEAPAPQGEPASEPAGGAFAPVSDAAGQPSQPEQQVTAPPEEQQSGSAFGEQQSGTALGEQQAGSAPGEQQAPAPAPEVEPVPGTGEEVSDGTAVEQQQSAFGLGQDRSVEAAAIEVPAVEVRPADFMAVDEDRAAEPFRAAGAGEGLDPVHSVAFADIVRRSRARADAASIIEDVDDSVVAAVDAAATSQGFSRTASGGSDDLHELSYVADDSSVLTVKVGRVRGRDLAGTDGEVPLEASVSSEHFGGEVDSGSGRHGEVVVSAVAHGSAHVASVELLLGLSDYVDAGYDVDRGRLESDLTAVVATLSHRLRG